MKKEDDETVDVDHDVCATCGGKGWVYDPSDGGTMCCPDCDGEAG